MTELTREQALWADALESGKYEQTTGYLNVLKPLDDGEKRPIGMCCLGVLCEAAIADGVRVRVTDRTQESGAIRRYANHDSDLPQQVMSWAGLRTRNGAYSDGSLDDDNDTGKSFQEIANIIRSKPQGLFRGPK